MKRRVAVIDGKGKVFLQEETIPGPGANEVLVKVQASLISPGTEMGGVKRLRASPDAKLPKRRFGYGNAGTILQAGNAVKRFEKGMRVACMGGGAVHGSHAIVPENLCIPLPENISFEEGAFAHLSATALQAVRRAQLEIGENVLILGLGIVGNIAGQLSRISGGHVLGADFLALRRRIARKTGFDCLIDPTKKDLVLVSAKFSRGYGIDCAVIAFGGEGSSALQEILQTMKTAPDTHKMGRVVIVGGCTITTNFAAAMGNVDLRSSARTGPGYHDPAYEHGKNYPDVFVPWTTQRNMEECLLFISEKRISVKPLITHRLSLSKVATACDLLIEHPEKSLGIILEERSGKGDR